MKRSDIEKLKTIKPWSDKYGRKRSYILNYFASNTPETHFIDGRIQCIRGRNRSFMDLYYLTRAKFKNTTKKELAKILYSINRREKIIGCIVCPDINEVVFYNTITKAYIDCIGIYMSPGNKTARFVESNTHSGFRFIDFAKLAEI